MTSRVAFALLLAATVACGSDRAAPGLPTATASPRTPAASGSPGSPRPVEVVRFGVLGGLVSAEIRNPNLDYALGPTRVRIVARDSRGGLVARSAVSARPGPKCCTVYALPPGGVHGVYVDVGPRGGRVAAVEVELIQPQWRRVDPSDVPAFAHLTGARLHRARDTAWVSGRLVVSGLRLADVAVQVSIEDRTGSLVAVVSAVVGCFREAAARPVRLELFRPLPADMVVAGVHAHPFPAGLLPTASVPAC